MVTDSPAGILPFQVTRFLESSGFKSLLNQPDPNDQEYHWVGISRAEWQPDPHADHTAVADGLVSVTPLHSDLTFHRALPAVEAWGLPEGKVP